MKICSEVLSNPNHNIVTDSKPAPKPERAKVTRPSLFSAIPPTPSGPSHLPSPHITATSPETAHPHQQLPHGRPRRAFLETQDGNSGPRRRRSKNANYRVSGEGDTNERGGAQHLHFSFSNGEVSQPERWTFLFPCNNGGRVAPTGLVGSGDNEPLEKKTSWDRYRASSVQRVFRRLRDKTATRDVEGEMQQVVEIKVCWWLNGLRRGRCVGVPRMGSLLSVSAKSAMSNYKIFMGSSCLLKWVRSWWIGERGAPDHVSVRVFDCWISSAKYFYLNINE